MVMFMTFMFMTFMFMAFMFCVLDVLVLLDVINVVVPAFARGNNRPRQNAR